MRIYLYTLISPANERTPVRRPFCGYIRNRGRRLLDLLSWNVLGRFDFHYYTYEDHVNTNEGDIAIRAAVREQLADILAGDHPEFVEISWHDLDKAAVEQINRDGDLVVIAGGYFHSSPEGELKAPVPKDARLFAAIRCPLLLYGAGANSKRTSASNAAFPLLNPASERTLRCLLQSISHCAVRDGHTALLLSAHGAPNPEVVLDPAMLLRPAGSPVALPEGIHIGLNFGFHGPHSESLLRRNIREYIQFARTMKRRYDCHFHYFVHSEGEELVVRLLRMAGIRLHIVRGPASVMLDYYGKMNIQVSHMMHSTILSLSAGTPTISLAYDVKNLAFYQLMQLEPYCMDANRVVAGELEKVAEELLRERDRVAAAISSRKALLAKRNAESLRTIAVEARRYAAERCRRAAMVY